MAAIFEPADVVLNRAALTTLNIQYLAWLEDNIRRDFSLELTALLEASIPDYVAATLDKLCASHPPDGVFYLVRYDGQVAGMGGVRRLADGVCEMKRVFVSSDQRGGGLGATIVKRLVADAEAFGYAIMRLESGPFMTSAHRLHEAEGFRDRDAYTGLEAPAELQHNWRFMEQRLGPVSAVG